MTAIGFVTRTTYGGFRGQLKLLPICADIDIVPNRDKSGDPSSDFRIFTQGLEVGSGRILTGENRGMDTSACHSQRLVLGSVSSAPTLVERSAFTATAASSRSGILSIRSKCWALAYRAGAHFCLSDIRFRIFPTGCAQKGEGGWTVCETSNFDRRSALARRWSEG